MRNCIEYVLRENKTNSGLVYITGPYQYSEIEYDKVYKSFIEEKKIWKKDNGRMYAHNIISFHKDEKITNEEAYQFGVEFAEKWFPNHQTLVAVHKDKEHVHIHFVTNSVSYVDGKKLHCTKADLEKMKKMTNDMCKERQLTIAHKGEHFDGSLIEKYDVTTWSKDKYNMFKNNGKKSYIADCVVAVAKSVKNCIDQIEFIQRMLREGWRVIWEEKRKHITFINEQGEKVRDTNLSKTFNIDISKEGLCNEFERNRRLRAGREKSGTETEGRDTSSDSREKNAQTAVRNQQGAESKTRIRISTEVEMYPVRTRSR